MFSRFFEKQHFVSTCAHDSLCEHVLVHSLPIGTSKVYLRQLKLQPDQCKARLLQTTQKSLWIFLVKANPNERLTLQTTSILIEIAGVVFYVHSFSQSKIINASKSILTM